MESKELVRESGAVSAKSNAPRAAIIGKIALANTRHENFISYRTIEFRSI
jgi:hypothetical protein